MNGLIENKRPELEEICRRRRVQRIELFGSAATADFDPAFALRSPSSMSRISSNPWLFLRCQTSAFQCGRCEYRTA